MSARIVPIAAKVRDALNGAAPGTFGLPFAAERAYQPQVDRKDLGTLKVWVVPSADARAPYTRDSGQRDVTVDIGIQREIGPAADPSDEDKLAELDAMMEFAEQVADFFTPADEANGLTDGTLAGTDYARWVGTANEVIYDPETLKTMRVFKTVVRVTFKVS